MLRGGRLSLPSLRAARASEALMASRRHLQITNSCWAEKLTRSFLHAVEDRPNLCAQFVERKGLANQVYT
jgi:hypothetical protein